MYEDGIACLWMRGGTSKGAYFLAEHLPGDPGERDALLLAIMGSPDPRQIDGIGGGDPLTSKVAVISASSREDADVDYLFLQVFVDQALVSDAQGCGNILAGVGPAAIERGLVKASGDVTPVRIHMVNSGEVAISKIETPNGRVNYRGKAEIAGVPGSHAAIPLIFVNIAGSMCGALLPTGNEVDVIDGIEATLIDNGMPCVIMRASDFGLSGEESREALEANEGLKQRIEVIRLKAGPMMNLGDVSAASVPKMTLVSEPRTGGSIGTRSFIPHRVHASVGVLAAVTVATATRLGRSPAHALAHASIDGRYRIEHPAGDMEVFLDLAADGSVQGAGTIRTARKLFDGKVFPNLPARPSLGQNRLD
ncbi:4-oxalomesaconate tautomerase [Rhizobium leguminosarum]|uniref:4-oxalomesaconate tautomerase n=1 Tax=Rhizobium leguminosarum TaxID=384 RepID=UPI0015DAE107|nr:4-oxalomesaconate tautomerase [Rhizobium leguminosarum]NZD52821.1 4-oxalomesaconate tautomerase [Rhizobium leguminosarum]